MNGLGGAMIDGTPFNVLMQQAVKLKTHRHKIDRVKFDRWPKFYQNSAFIRDEQRPERGYGYPERMEKAEDYKRMADDFFVRGDFMRAGIHYEYALGLFKWATPLDSNWRNKSVDDTEMKEEEFLGENDEERTRINGLRVRLLLNLARCYFKQNEFLTARQACDWALGLDDTCVKALLIRAKCLVAPLGHGASDRDLAIHDLDLAVKMSQVPDREVMTLLKRLRNEKKQGKLADQKYAGLFGRGEIYDPDEKSKRQRPFMEAPIIPEKDTEKEVDELSRAPLEVQLKAAEGLLSQYEDEARKGPEVEELRKAIEDTRKRIALDQEQKKPMLDFRSPTPEMLTDAKQRGIDLHDPQVIDMLEKIQAERLDPDRQARYDTKLTEISHMSMEDLMQALKVRQIDHQQCQTKAHLQRLLVENLIDEDEINNTKQHTTAPHQKKTTPPKATSWKFTLFLAFVFLVLRFSFSKLLRPLFSSVFFGTPLPHSHPPSSNNHPLDSNDDFIVEDDSSYNDLLDREQWAEFHDEF